MNRFKKTGINIKELELVGYSKVVQVIQNVQSIIENAEKKENIYKVRDNKIKYNLKEVKRQLEEIIIYGGYTDGEIKCDDVNIIIELLIKYKATSGMNKDLISKSLKLIKNIKTSLYINYVKKNSSNNTEKLEKIVNKKNIVEMNETIKDTDKLIRETNNIIHLITIYNKIILNLNLINKLKAVFVSKFIIELKKIKYTNEYLINSLQRFIKINGLEDEINIGINSQVKKEIELLSLEYPKNSHNNTSSPYENEAITYIRAMFHNLLFYTNYFHHGIELDLYFPDLKLNIEIDGKQHKENEKKEKDKKRDSTLKKDNIEVRRVKTGRKMKESIKNILSGEYQVKMFKNKSKIERVDKEHLEANFYLNLYSINSANELSNYYENYSREILKRKDIEKIKILVNKFNEFKEDIIFDINTKKRVKRLISIIRQKEKEYKLDKELVQYMDNKLAYLLSKIKSSEDLILFYNENLYDILESNDKKLLEDLLNTFFTYRDEIKATEENINLIVELANKVLSLNKDNKLAKGIVES